MSTTKHNLVRLCTESMYWHPEPGWLSQGLCGYVLNRPCLHPNISCAVVYWMGVLTSWTRVLIQYTSWASIICVLPFKHSSRRRFCDIVLCILSEEAFQLVYCIGFWLSAVFNGSSVYWSPKPGWISQGLCGCVLNHLCLNPNISCAVVYWIGVLTFGPRLLILYTSWASIIWVLPFNHCSRRRFWDVVHGIFIIGSLSTYVLYWWVLPVCIMTNLCTALVSITKVERY